MERTFIEKQWHAKLIKHTHLFHQGPGRKGMKMIAEQEADSRGDNNQTQLLPPNREASSAVFAPPKEGTAASRYDANFRLQNIIKGQ